MVKRKLTKHQKVSKYYVHHCLKNFFSLFISLLTASIVKNSEILAEIYFDFLKKRPVPNLKVFQHQILTSVKRLEKCLSIKVKFSTFLELCSKFEILRGV